MRLASDFTLFPAYLTNARDDAGFFDGHDNPSTCMVVLFNALIGLAISTVCKYADAVVKTIAIATVAVNPVIRDTELALRPAAAFGRRLDGRASRGYCHGDVREDY
jgi:hypothetical protein